MSIDRMLRNRGLDYGLAAYGVVFDPLTLTGATMALTGIGGAMTAAGTLAGGSYAKTAGEMQKKAADFQADQLDQNASQAIASGQRQMFDTQLRTKQAISTARARGAASGIDIGVGSPATNEGEIAKRGSYHALVDMFNGESAASGIKNQAKGVRYTGDMAELEGEMKQTASYLSAAGTLAGTAGGMTSTFGKFKYPTSKGNFGA